MQRNIWHCKHTSGWWTWCSHDNQHNQRRKLPTYVICYCAYHSRLTRSVLCGPGSYVDGIACLQCAAGSFTENLSNTTQCTVRMASYTNIPVTTASISSARTATTTTKPGKQSANHVPLVRLHWDLDRRRATRVAMRLSPQVHLSYSYRRDRLIPYADPGSSACDKMTQFGIILAAIAAALVTVPLLVLGLQNPVSVRAMVGKRPRFEAL